MSLLPPFQRLLLPAIALVVAAACGGKTTGGVVSPPPATPGESCKGEGSQVPAADGCNTCTCANEKLACTELDCTAGDGGGATACVPGATRSAGDDCNTCSCSTQGEWICTRSVCNLCKEGDTKKVDCNTCSCSGGAWQCTKQACLPPTVCTDGQTMQQDCNTCTCSGGQWGGCTERACPVTADGGFDDGAVKTSCGARAGNTCADSEYCAYAEGQLCGAADASATCEPRPVGCPTILSPVCGCDGKSYASACMAAVAGTGVNQSGDCPAH